MPDDCNEAHGSVFWVSNDCAVISSRREKFSVVSPVCMMEKQPDLIESIDRYVYTIYIYVTSS